VPHVHGTRAIRVYSHIPHNYQLPSQPKKPLFYGVFQVFSFASRLDGFWLVFVPPPEKTLPCHAAPSGKSFETLSSLSQVGPRLYPMGH